MENKFKKKVLFIGMPDMAYICLDGLYAQGVNIVGVIGAKKNHPTYENFKNFTLERNLNFIDYESLKDESFIEKIKGLNPDIAVVCSFNYKIPKVFLDCVKDGFINIHPSLLPNYRGKNPYASVIINNEKLTGVTLHFMDEGFDTGDIIAQKEFSISPKETMGTLFNKTNLIGYEHLLATLKHYENHPIPRQKQPEGSFVKAKSFPDEKLFIDFDKPAVEIERFVRALNPFLNASSVFRKTFVKVFSAEYENKNNKSKHEVGMIVKVTKDKFYIKTAQGLLVPTSLQFGSFFAGSAKEFIEILKPKIGEKWGA